MYVRFPFSDETQCIQCPAGFYCPGGTESQPTTAPTPCQPGTYNPDANTGHPLNCHKCDIGFACPEINHTASVVPCKAGMSTSSHTCKLPLLKQAMEDFYTR